MINIQDFFDKLQERSLLFINEEGRVSVEMNSVINTLFELNELEKTEKFIDENKVEEIKQQEKDDPVPCKIRKRKESNKRWTKEEDAFLIEALNMGITYKKIAETLKGRTIRAIIQRACYYKKSSHLAQKEENKN